MTRTQSAISVGDVFWKCQPFLLVILVIYALSSFSYASEGVQLMWKFQTGGKIYSSPTIDGDVVYIGSWDSCLYAINRIDGTEKWKFKANYPIQSKPAVYQNIICFESGDEFWGLDKVTGQKVWQFTPQVSNRVYQYDQWDYHHSSPVLVDSTFFVGCGNGKVYGINASAGTVVFEYLANASYAVRTNVTFNDSILYFGDWHGTFYALDMRSKNLLWSLKTSYPGQPNGNAVPSSGVIYDSMVLFGGRCTSVFGKDAKTGTTIWKFTDARGSWMVADPVIDNGVLFVGGSDYGQFYAFQADNGNLLWKDSLIYNILSTPFNGSDYILFATENAYGSGPGTLWVVNKADGSARQNYSLTSNIVSSPIVVDSVTYFGCNDGYIYALKGLTSIQPTSIENKKGGTKQFRLNQNHPNPFNPSTNISFTIPLRSYISLKVYNLLGREVKTLISEIVDAGTYSHQWNAANMSSGIYFYRLQAGTFTETKKLVLLK